MLISTSIILSMIVLLPSSLSVRSENTPPTARPGSIARDPCGLSIQAEYDKVNKISAINIAHDSPAFKSESSHFTNTAYYSTYEVVKWSGMQSCIPINEDYDVVFSGYSSSRFAGYVVVSEDPVTLTPRSVSLQLDNPRFSLCSSSPCGQGIWAGYEVYANSAQQTSPVYDAYADFYQPIPKDPPSGCAALETCDLSNWVGLEDQGQASDSNLAQDGTAAVWKFDFFYGSTISYFAWYEWSPNTNSAVECNGVLVHGGDEIRADTSNEASVRGGSNSLYDFLVLDYNTDTSCYSPGNSYTQMTTPYYADYILENFPYPSGCSHNCASLAEFDNGALFTGATMALTPPCCPRDPNNFFPIYYFTPSGWDYQDTMVNSEGQMVNQPYTLCHSPVTNVGAGPVDSSSSFTLTWYSSQNTPWFNTYC